MNGIGNSFFFGLPRRGQKISRLARKSSLITNMRQCTITFKIPSYDSDKSGAIDKKEMTRVMKSIYAMLGTKGNDRSSLDEKVLSSTKTKTIRQHKDIDHQQLVTMQQCSSLLEVIDYIIELYFPRQLHTQQDSSNTWTLMATVN